MTTRSTHEILRFCQESVPFKRDCVSKITKYRLFSVLKFWFRVQVSDTLGSETCTSRIHWVPRGTGTPQDRDEVNRRGVSEWDVVSDLDTTGVSSIFKIRCSTTTFTRIIPRVQGSGFRVQGSWFRVEG